jgi:hypothetical protein
VGFAGLAHFAPAARDRLGAGLRAISGGCSRVQLASEPANGRGV